MDSSQGPSEKEKGIGDHATELWGNVSGKIGSMFGSSSPVAPAPSSAIGGRKSRTGKSRTGKSRKCTKCTKSRKCARCNKTKKSRTNRKSRKH